MRDCISYSEIDKLMRKAKLLGNISLAYNELGRMASEFVELNNELTNYTGYKVSTKRISNYNNSGSMLSVPGIELTITSEHYKEWVTCEYDSDYKILDNRKIRICSNLFTNRVDKALREKGNLTLSYSMSQLIEECSGCVEVVRNDGKFHSSWKLKYENTSIYSMNKDTKSIIAGLRKVKEIAIDELIINKKRMSIKRHPECYGLSLILER